MVAATTGVKQHQKSPRCLSRVRLIRPSMRHWSSRPSRSSVYCASRRVFLSFFTAHQGAFFSVLLRIEARFLSLIATHLAHMSHTHSSHTSPRLSFF